MYLLHINLHINIIKRQDPKIGFFLLFYIIWYILIGLIFTYKFSIVFDYFLDISLK